MAANSRTVIGGLYAIRDAIIASGATGGIEFPNLAIGPVEKVLVFNVRTKITLIPGASPYFSSQGDIVDLAGKVLKGSRSATALPTNSAIIPTLAQWPNPQGAPFDKIPPDVDNTNVNTLGYSKQEYFFGDEDGSSLVTVGPSLPKLTLLEGGGAQFWVGSLGAVSQGTGKYLGAKGMGAFDGSAYFKVWPTDPKAIQALLAKGFKALVATYFKVVLAQDQG